jgi:hypothetical protein
MTRALTSTFGSHGVDRFTPDQLLRTARLFASNRFARLGLPKPLLISDAEAVSHGRPDPKDYLLAPRKLGGRSQRVPCHQGRAFWRCRRSCGWGQPCGRSKQHVPTTGAERTYPILNDAVSDVVEFAPASAGSRVTRCESSWRTVAK